MEQLEIPLENTGFVLKHVNTLQTTSHNSFAVELKLTNGFNCIGYYQAMPNEVIDKEEGESEAFYNAVTYLISLNPSHLDWKRYQEYCVKELVNER